MIGWLARIWSQRGRVVAQHFGCGCKPGQCDGRPQDSPAWGGRWSRCPVGLLDTDPMWSEIVRLHACARISPLVEWPGGYSAGVVSGLLTLRAEQDAEEARQLRKASKG